VAGRQLGLQAWCIVGCNDGECQEETNARTARQTDAAADVIIIDQCCSSQNAKKTPQSRAILNVTERLMPTRN